MNGAEGLVANRADAAILGFLIDGPPPDDGAVRPGESWPVRTIVLLAAPIWGLAVLSACALRLARRRLPLLVFHERVGHAGRRFMLPKVATMSLPPNRRSLGGLVEFATGLPDDTVVEGRVERWLRLTGLDETPQLGLVVWGRMRLVGPRPVTAVELAEMRASAGGELAIDVLHPGLVGVWQVLDRHAYTLEQRAELDRFMVDHWSPSLRRRIAVVAARQGLRRLLPADAHRAPADVAEPDVRGGGYGI